MKSIPTLAAILFILHITPVLAQINTKVDDSEAIDFMKKNQFVHEQFTLNPIELAGSLIFEKDGELKMYMNVLTEDEKKKIKPLTITGSRYRTMLSQGVSADTTILGIVKIKGSASELVEVAIDERWQAIGPGLMESKALQKDVLTIAKFYQTAGYKIHYNSNMRYATLTTSVYQKREGEAKSTFTYIDASGDIYVQNTNFTLREIISIAPIDITIWVAAWDPTKKSALNHALTQSTLSQLKNRTVTSPIGELVPALEAFASMPGTSDGI